MLVSKHSGGLRIRIYGLLLFHYCEVISCITKICSIMWRDLCLIIISEFRKIDSLSFLFKQWIKYLVYYYRRWDINLGQHFKVSLYICITEKITLFIGYECSWPFYFLSNHWEINALKKNNYESQIMYRFRISHFFLFFIQFLSQMISTVFSP